MMPLLADTRTPAVPISQMIEIDLVMVTAPKPPGSRQLISPPGAVFEMAPGKVLHGAVRLHGLTSSPTPETQVLVACATAASGINANKATQAKPNIAAIVFMGVPPLRNKSNVLLHQTARLQQPAIGRIRTG
jgi:hypothetical protein